jgi:hypothetical protein
MHHSPSGAGCALGYSPSENIPGFVSLVEDDFRPHCGSSMTGSVSDLSLRVSTNSLGGQFEVHSQYAAPNRIESREMTSDLGAFACRSSRGLHPRRDRSK